MKHKILISPTNTEIIQGLISLGISVVYTKEIQQLRKNEQYHADMQLCIINDTAFIPIDCRDIEQILIEYGYQIRFCKALQEKYPENILLNAALIGDRLFCKESDVAEEIKEFCSGNSIKIINVNQGYTKCSTLIINDTAIITADPSIAKAATEQGIDVLKISAGSIHLDDADYGFIGGSSGVIGDTVYFFGDITSHPDYIAIIDFINKYNMNYISVTNGKLCDVGGFVLIK